MNGVDILGPAAVGTYEVCADEVCITCADEGRVAEVVAVAGDGQADVVVDGRREMVDISLVDAGPGERVLVHAGVAISVLGPPRAPA